MFRETIEVIKQSFAEWSEDGAPRLAAALAYYTVFSLAPLFFIAVAVAGLVFADADARVASQLGMMVGDDTAAFVIETAQQSGPTGGIVSTVIGIGVLLFGAAGLFGQLQDSLNTIWEVRPKPGQGLMAFIRRRFFSFGLVGGTAFLLLVSLIASTAVAAAVDYFSESMPGLAFLWQVLNFVVAAAAATGIFALIFKFVPDVQIRWHDVWPGAAFTGVLFTIGQIGLSLYLGWQADDSIYGAAGSLIVLLLWVYYAAQILFFGAEFTQVTATRRGRPLIPARGAEAVSEQERTQQGLTRHSERPRTDARLSLDTAPAISTAVVALGFFAGALAQRMLRHRGRRQ